jgi:C2 domain/PH domain/SH3 domain
VSCLFCFFFCFFFLFFVFFFLRTIFDFAKKKKKKIMAAALVGKKPDKEGFLEKIGKAGGAFGFGRLGRLGGWRKRWCVIMDFELKYFEKKVRDGKGKAQGSIPLQGVIQVCGGKLGAARSQREHGFTVSIKDRVFCFSAENDEIAQQWVDAIREQQLKALLHYGTHFLRMRICGARSIKAADANGTSDAYCVVTVGGDEYKSEIVMKSLEPRWDETFTWIVANASTPVELAVWDYDRLASDEKLGALPFSLQMLATKCDKEEVVEWHTLQPLDSGEVELGLTVGGFSGHDASEQPEIDPVMEFYLKYVKRDKDGNMVVDGLPESWEMLFKKAGIRPDELKNPTIVSELIKIMTDALKDTSKLGSGDGGDGKKKKKRGERPISKAKVLWDFEAQQEGDLPLAQGDIVFVYEKKETGWWRGKKEGGDGTQGLFPGNYCEEIARRKAAAPAKALPAAPKKELPAAPTKALPAKPADPAPGPPQGDGDDKEEAAPPGLGAVPSEPAPAPPPEPAPAPPKDVAPAPPPDAAPEPPKAKKEEPAAKDDKSVASSSSSKKHDKKSSSSKKHDRKSKHDKKSSRKSNKPTESAPAPPAPEPSTKSSKKDKKDKKPPAKSIPPAPTKPAPTPAAGDDDAAAPDAPPAPPVASDAPKPPPMPPAAPVAPTPPPPVAASSGGGAAARPAPPPAGNHGGLLGAIGGFDKSKLKKAETPKGGVDALDDRQMNSLVGLLSNALNARRADLKEDVDSDEESADSDWEDDDWE